MFAHVVTDEALKALNAELGKRFVAKAEFNAKGEKINKAYMSKSSQRWSTIAISKQKKAP